jgi:hypothetical protein
MKPDRRQFLIKSGTTLGLSAASPGVLSIVNALAIPGAASNQPPTEVGVANLPDEKRPLYNTNLQTAIGLGDEPPGLLDKFGQLKTRNADVQLEIGAPSQPLTKAGWLQSLQDGYLPIVRTEVRASQGSLRWVAFTSEAEGVKADYLGLEEAKGRYRIALRFPYTTSIKVSDGIVTNGDKILAFFAPTKQVVVSQAKYSYLTPQAGAFETPGKPLPGLDPAFGGGRSGFLNSAIEYRFPVTTGKAFHVFLGLRGSSRVEPGEMLIRLSVNGQSQVADMGLAEPGKPSMPQTPSKRQPIPRG